MYQAGLHVSTLARRTTDEGLCIFRDFARKSLRARSALECGSLLPLLRAELARVLPEASFRRRKAAAQDAVVNSRPLTFDFSASKI
jgi:hypothetical protein